MPNSRYDSFTFISHNTFVLPCARTESLNIFIFRPTPPAGEFDRGPAIKHLCALQLPSLVSEAKYVSVTCRSRPTPDSMQSPPPTQRLERPPKYFEPDRDSGVVVFSAHVSNAGRGKDISIICNRKSLLRFIAPDPEMLGDPLPEPWESYPYVIQPARQIDADELSSVSGWFLSPSGGVPRSHTKSGAQSAARYPTDGLTSG